MGSRTIRLFEFTDYDFSGLSFGGTAGAIWAPQNIPVAPYRNGVLIVRMRSYNLAASGATVTFQLFPVAPDPEDPSKFYRSTTKGYPLSGVSFAGAGSASAQLKTATLTDDNSPLPSFMTMLISVAQGSPANTLTFTASADLVLKD